MKLYSETGEWRMLRELVVFLYPKPLRNIFRVFSARLATLHHYKTSQYLDIFYKAGKKCFLIFFSECDVFIVFLNLQLDQVYLYRRRYLFVKVTPRRGPILIHF